VAVTFRERLQELERQMQDMWEWRLSSYGQRITESPTKETSCGAEEPTTPTTPASSQSGTLVMPSGLVGQSCSCAEPKLGTWSLTLMGPSGQMESRLRFRCEKCGAFMWYARIPVLVAATDSLTLVRQDSSTFATQSKKESATLPSTPGSEVPY